MIGEPARDGVVLLTDRAWPDDVIERRIIGDAGFGLVTGPAKPAPASEIEQLVAVNDPIAIMTCWARVSAAAVASPSRLMAVARMGVGLDNIAVDAATARGAYVTNVPDYCVEEVSDHAVALVLNWSRGVTTFDREVRSGLWNPASASLGRLSSKTIGLVGCGRIGRVTARKFEGLGCRILVHDRHLDGTNGPVGVEAVAMSRLLSDSDVVILHVPLTNETHHLIGRDELKTMRRGALLVNVSRGGLVDTSALVEALEAEHIDGAALDVLEEEPEVDPRLLAHPRVAITPHIAFSSDESVIELRTKASHDVVRVLRGEAPTYPCNAPLPTAIRSREPR
jgi:D-3-phosphoglycerate dehydrogenase